MRHAAAALACALGLALASAPCRAAGPPASGPAAEDSNNADGDRPAPGARLQRAGWWSLFGAFAVGTVAGVMAGLAEREEDKAVAVATRVDPQTGLPPLYADEQDNYERILRRGRTLQRSAIGLAAIAGAAAVSAVVLFAVGVRRNKRAGGQRASWSPTGLEVRF